MRWQAWPWSIPLLSRISSATDRKHGRATNHKSRVSPWFPGCTARDSPLVVQARSGVPRIAAPAARADRCTQPLHATSEYLRTRVFAPTQTLRLGSTGSLGNKPLAVVTAGKSEPSWLNQQDDLVTLSPNSGGRQSGHLE